jgi:hypothetical protein
LPTELKHTTAPVILNVTLGPCDLYSDSAIDTDVIGGRYPQLQPSPAYSGVDRAGTVGSTSASVSSELNYPVNDQRHHGALLRRRAASILLQWAEFLSMGVSRGV